MFGKKKSVGITVNGTRFKTLSEAATVHGIPRGQLSKKFKAIRKSGLSEHELTFNVRKTVIVTLEKGDKL